MSENPNNPQPQFNQDPQFSQQAPQFNQQVPLPVCPFTTPEQQAQAKKAKTLVDCLSGERYCELLCPRFHPWCCSYCDRPPWL